MICLTVPKSSVGETFCVVFQKLTGSEKSLWIRRGGGGYQDVPLKVFCLTVPKNFVEEPFSVSLIPSIENLYASEGYVTIFC